MPLNDEPGITVDVQDRLLRAEPPAPRRRGRFSRTATRFVLVPAIALVLASIAVVFVLRFVPPPTTAFMLAQRVSGGAVNQQWVPLERISAELPIAVVAAEDQKFPQHRGFDLESIEEALDENGRGGRVRGASTISQQVAKNLFLWSGRSWLRKGLEAYFTVLIEGLWPKRRIMEVYLNIAQFGPGLYGAEAASLVYFGKSARALTQHEAALLAAVLPSPSRLHADRPSAYVLERVRWIRRQIAQLGGPAYALPVK